MSPLTWECVKPVLPVSKCRYALFQMNVVSVDAVDNEFNLHINKRREALEVATTIISRLVSSTSACLINLSSGVAWCSSNTTTAPCHSQSGCSDQTCKAAYTRDSSRTFARAASLAYKLKIVHHDVTLFLAFFIN